MGVNLPQAEVRAALKPIFSHISNVYLIRDDLIIATKNMEEYLHAIREVMEVIKSKNLILNPHECTFGSKEIKI